MKLCSYGHISEIINGRCEICDTKDITEYYSVEEIEKVLMNRRGDKTLTREIIESLRKYDRNNPR